MRYWILSLVGCGLCVAALFAYARFQRKEPNTLTGTPQVQVSYEELVNCRFRPAPSDPSRAPTLRPIAIPDFEGSYAIWGSTGRDSRGHIWIGASAAMVPIPSAHLFEFAPESGQLTDRGDVVSALKRAGLYREGEGQMKIHSRIVQAADGYLYFASMDEQGEKTDGSRLPTWRSHLWRLDPTGNQWEHLLSTPEALIAVAGVGMRVYALGYFDHVVYQYDCSTGNVRSVRVGALGGHISRNFLCDENGHVYVPRLKANVADSSVMETSLVELDTSLQEVAEVPLRHYTMTKDDDSHGIVGIQYLADRSMAFTTDQGFLYRIVPHQDRPADVTELGWLHPNGPAYVASLFTFDGERHLLGASRRANENHYEWLVYDLERQVSTATPLELPLLDNAPPANLLLYGSNARDNLGSFYLVGTYSRSGKATPIVFQASVDLHAAAE